MGVRQTRPGPMPKGGEADKNRYVRKAEAEKASVETNKAHPIRLCLTGRATAASPTSQVIYQEKNHGVTINRTPNVAKAERVKVRVVGERHIQSALRNPTIASSTKLRASHTLRLLKM